MNNIHICYDINTENTSVQRSCNEISLQTHVLGRRDKHVFKDKFAIKCKQYKEQTYSLMHAHMRLLNIAAERHYHHC